MIHHLTHVQGHTLQPYTVVASSEKCAEIAEKESSSITAKSKLCAPAVKMVEKQLPEVT